LIISAAAATDNAALAQIRFRGEPAIGALQSEISADFRLRSSAAGCRALITTAHHSEAVDHETKRDTG